MHQRFLNCMYKTISIPFPPPTPTHQLLYLTMSPISVPAPLKSFFNTFPLIEHPPHPQTTSDERIALKRQHINFQTSVTNTITKHCSYHFKLCVYNTFIGDSDLILATDPVSLSLQIQLALKRGLKLGRFNGHDGQEDGEDVDLKADSMFVISHHGSEDGILPIYIERSKESKTAGAVRTCSVLNEQLLADVKTSSEKLLIKLVDVVIYDFFIVTTLLKMNKETQLRLFTSYSTPQEKFINGLGLHESLSCLVRRNGFDLRYPNICKQYQHTITSAITPQFLLSCSSSSQAKAIDVEYLTALTSFQNAITNLSSVYESSSTSFYNDSSSPGLLDVKVASYCIIANEFFNNTEFGELLRSCDPKLRQLAGKVLKCVS